jgi:AcrR family transcriptional regulator
MIDKQAEILKAALRLFVENGFHGTPTSLIAKEAGVANGTLFHYFNTKEDLIVSLYVAIKKNLSACITIHPDDTASLKDKLKYIYVMALKWGIDNTIEFRFVQQFISSPYLLKLAPEEIQQKNNMILMLFQQGIDEHIIKPIPVDLINTLVNSHLFGVSQYILQSQFSEAEQDKIINDSYELVWDMIAQ